MSRFKAFDEDDSTGSEGGSSISGEPALAISSQRRAAVHHHNNDIIAMEDLSTLRRNEELALETVYLEDFSRKKGIWGSCVYEVRIRPPDLSPEDVGSSLVLSVQLPKRYPYIAPQIIFEKVKGLNKNETRDLMKQVQNRAKECAEQGQEMMFELVIVVEEFLLRHNRTPEEQRMSAWEQMKRREEVANTAKNKLAASEEHTSDHILGASFSSDEDDHDYASGALRHSTSSGRQNQADVLIDSATGLKVERELMRQVEAIDRRRKASMGSFTEAADRHDSSDSHNDNEDLNDNDGNNNDDYDDYRSHNSRYLSDFNELGILGKGGGGEVVKCRNRLDRRIYAVKKILLEPEKGRFAKFAAVRNQKLRREVTTISRMTHKNIVRYYQAWEEGGFDSDRSSDDSVDASPSENTQGEFRSDPHPNDNINDASSDSDTSEVYGGFWNRSPNIGPLQSERSSFSESDLAPADSDTSSAHFASFNGLYNDDHDFDLQKNPLFLGTGVGQHDAYEQSMKLQNNTDAMRSSSVKDSEDEENLFDSGVKIKQGGKHIFLYIQMEYCSTTLRHLIDQGGILNKENEAWRLTRQIVEALCYIHSRKLIHRDLKPSNIFLDSENNVRMGDFGLATTTSKRSSLFEIDDSIQNLDDTDESSLYRQCRNLHHSETNGTNSFRSKPTEALTGGVGTAFYRAPEQEGTNAGPSGYSSKVDIYSIGIILFEMFHAPFSTYMERADILSNIRGDNETSKAEINVDVDFMDDSDDWKKVARKRFPKSFDMAPDNAKRMILWCLQKNAAHRPSAEDLLSSQLLPRKMELEKHYLEEALQTLANPQSESYDQILRALFNQVVPYHVEVTYDNGDIAIDAIHRMKSVDTMKNLQSTIGKLGGKKWNDFEGSGTRLSAMSAISVAAITSSLARAKGAGKLEQSGMDMGAPQRTATVLAMAAGAASAITGAADGVLGADPRLQEAIVAHLQKVFRTHSAVSLSGPLLVPSRGHQRQSEEPSEEASHFSPVEVMDERGYVLLLPEDLTANFARAISRGGIATSHVKRYEIGKVYHKPLLGCHPRESLEAAFDIVFHDPHIKGNYVEAEVIQVLSQVVTALATSSEFSLHGSSENNEVSGLEKNCLVAPFWFVKVSHTRLSDAILDLCGVPSKNEVLRKRCLRILSKTMAPSPATLCSKARNYRGQQPFPQQIQHAVKHHDLDSGVAAKLELFLSFTNAPFSHNITAALDALLDTTRKYKATEHVEKGSKRAKLYDTVYKGIRSLRRLVEALAEMGIQPVLPRAEKYAPNLETGIRQPAFIALDFSQQRQRHLHGHLYFQGIILPSDYFLRLSDCKNKQSFEQIRKEELKFAEGGRFDDLIRSYRPPGNFGSNVANLYTAAPIPFAAGVRFHIGRIIDRIYGEAALRKTICATSGVTGNEAESIRNALGHPLPTMHFIRCIVSGPNGMDASSVGSRAKVASILWAGGISAEYMAQSGAIMSLLKNNNVTEGLSSDWSLEQLHQICRLLRIPFVIIVSPHFLRDKQCVRVKHILHDAHGSFHDVQGGNEEVVSLASLVLTIKECLEGKQRKGGRK